MGAKIVFAPLPGRAIGDQRLRGLHFRVLAAICLHDRMSGSRGKGQGCWAGNKTLADECGCHFTNLSTAITDLGRWGYVERETHPLNKKLRVYRVIYGAADHLPTDKQSPPTDEETVCPETNHAAETVCPQFDETEQNQSDAKVNIFRETGNTLGETLEAYSAQAAHSDERAAGCEGKKPRTIGATLAIVERRLKQMREAPQPDDVLHLDPLEEFLESVVTAWNGHSGDPIGGRALRLLDELGWIKDPNAA